MISFININSSPPYKKFLDFYHQALKDEKFIDAICISSFDKSSDQVDSRFVNLKYIKDDEWIFFTNYNSPKAFQFKQHDQISAVFFWRSTYSQIRMKAKVIKTCSDFCDEHYRKRDASKNKIATISNQSERIESYDHIVENFNSNRCFNPDLMKRPDYWGGYSFTPYYFEFWEGHDYRINKRTAYQLKEDNWVNFYLQP